MKKIYFKTIFWSYFLIVIDININNIDILPDFIGYIILLFSFYRLSEYGEGFKKAIIPCILSIMMCGLALYQSIALSTKMMTALNFGKVFDISFTMASLILDIIIIDKMYKGFYDIAKSINQSSLADDVLQMGKAIIILQLMISLSICGVLMGWIIFVLFSWILSLIFIFMMLSYLDRIGKVLPELYNRYISTNQN